MPQTIDPNKASPAAVLRLLSGALRGGEFVLEPGTTLFVAHSPDAMAMGSGAVQPEFPDNAIFVPTDEGGGNFEVEVLPQDDGPPSILVRDLNYADADTTDAEPHAYAPNTVRRIAGLDIAVRPQDEMWSAEVRNYGMAIAPIAAIAAAAAPNHSPSLQPKTNAQSHGKAWRIAGAALLTTSLIGVAGAMYWMQSASGLNAMSTADAASAQKKKNRLTQAQQLSASLLGAGQYRVVPGSDGQLYVFAADERAASWARQAILRGDEAAKARVIQKGDERVRIERLLDNLAPAYHTVRLANPAKPEIWLSRERAPLTAAAAKALAQRLTAALPYADSVDIRFVADATVAGQAEAGLERLGVQHRKTDNGDSITMSIRGALPDGELQKMHNYVETFYRQWGTHYVHFSVEMRDDMRKGKSFEYGSESYLKPTASHWDFSVQS